MRISSADLRVSYFRSGTRSKFSRDTLTLSRIFNKIKNDTRIEIHTQEAQSEKLRGEDEYRTYKARHFPAFTASGIFKERTKETFLSSSGLVMVDIDYVKPANLIRIFELLEKDEYCVIAYTSISGAGLHIVCAVHPIPINSTMYSTAFPISHGTL